MRKVQQKGNPITPRYISPYLTQPNHSIQSYVLFALLLQLAVRTTPTTL